MENKLPLSLSLCSLCLFLSLCSLSLVIYLFSFIVTWFCLISILTKNFQIFVSKHPLTTWMNYGTRQWTCDDDTKANKDDKLFIILNLIWVDYLIKQNSSQIERSLIVRYCSKGRGCYYDLAKEFSFSAPCYV